LPVPCAMMRPFLAVVGRRGMPCIVVSRDARVGRLVAIANERMRRQLVDIAKHLCYFGG
jgi:hypothetical protein